MNKLKKRYLACADPGGGSGPPPPPPPPPPPGILAKNVVIGFVNGPTLILHSIYVEYNPE